MEHQRGFTLLEMMLVALLAGIAASLVVMAFPTERQNDSAWQMAYFRAQLEFAVEDSQLNESVLGVRIERNRWEFIQLVANEGGEAAQALSDQFRGYHWQPWRPHRIKPSATLPERLSLELQPMKGAAAPVKRDQKKQDDTPDVLILPGGEITPFRLVFNGEGKTPALWLQVDATGRLLTSLDTTGLRGDRL